MLIILSVRPSAAPEPSIAFELAHDETVFQDGAWKRLGPIEILSPGWGQYLIALDVGIDQWIDVDCATPAVIGEHPRLPGCIAAIERRRVIRRHGSIVIASIIFDGNHSLDLKSNIVQAFEERNHFIRQIAMNQKCAGARLVFEVPEAQGQLAKILGRNRTTGMPGGFAYSSEQRGRYGFALENRGLSPSEQNASNQRADTDSRGGTHSTS